MIDLSLLPDFVAESVEHLEEMETNLLRLEADPGNLEILNDIFRSVHTIKGASEYMGMIKTAELSHKLENLLDMIRKGETSLNKEIIDTLIEARDLISMLVSELEQSQTEETDTASIIKRIDRLSIETETEKDAHSPGNASQTETGSELEDADFETAIEMAVDDVMEIAPSTGIQSDPEDEPDAILVEEIRGDDLGDPELFAIFTNQLNDSFTKILAYLNDPPHSDGVVEIFNQYTDIIKTLRSSANYMGYDNLAIFYENWITAIEQTQAESVQSGKLSWSDFIKFQLKPYINKIVSLFPQLQKFRIDAQRLEEIDDSKYLPIKTKEEGLETVKAVDTKRIAETIEAGETESVVEISDIDEISDEVEPVVAIGPEEPNEFTDTAEPEKAVESVKADDTKSVTGTIEEEETESVVEITDIDEIEPVAAAETEVPGGPDHIGAETDELPKTAEVEDAAMPPLENDKMLFDKLASAYDFYREDHIHRTSDSQDMIDANLFSKSDLTPEGHPIIESGTDETGKYIELTSDEAFPKRPLPDETKAETELPGLAETSETPAVSEIPEIEIAPVPPFVAETQEAEEKIKAEPDLTPEESGTPSAPKAPKTEAKAKSDVSEKKSLVTDELQETVTTQASEPAEGLSLTGKTGETAPIAGTTDADVTKAQLKEKQYGVVMKKSVRVDANKIDALMNQVGELVVSRAWFSQLYNEMRDLQQYLKESSRLEQKEMKQVRAITFRLNEATVNLGRVATELQEGVMRVRMLPISQLFNRYPRLVRDLIHDTPKRVTLDIRGEATELDKMIIEKISDPLIHIIRNAVDHGIESTNERRRLGKPETGRIILEAYHESNHVVIEVRDDGQGLNPDKIKEVALAGAFITQEELAVMSLKDVTSLILKPGFSTAAQVTHTSGRGVGMDVVKKNIEKLNGTLEIDSEQGAFTQLRIKIPLTLAIIPALLVRVGKELYTIPLATVEETLRIAEEDNSTIEGNEVIYIRNATLPLVRLSELFDIPVDEQLKGKEFVVIVSTGLKKIGLVVDDLIGQEEVVIKPLEDYLQEKSGFSGATILGDGRVSLILDVYELVNLTIERVTLMRSQKTVYGDFGNYSKAGRSVSEARVAAM